MGRRRGILLKRRFRTLFRRLFQLKSSQDAYRRLDDHRAKPLSRLVSWTSRLRTKAKSMLGKKICSSRGFIRVEQDPFLQKQERIPKGHIAVYVGQEDGEFQRMFVPVVYFNHPLFGDLLKESEREYGFNHSGGITIPCRISEFERVQTRIKSVQSTRKL